LVFHTIRIAQKKSKAFVKNFTLWKKFKNFYLFFRQPKRKRRTKCAALSLCGGYYVMLLQGCLLQKYKLND